MRSHPATHGSSRRGRTRNGWTRSGRPDARTTPLLFREGWMHGIARQRDGGARAEPDIPCGLGPAWTVAAGARRPSALPRISQLVLAGLARRRRPALRNRPADVSDTVPERERRARGGHAGRTAFLRSLHG